MVRNEKRSENTGIEGLTTVLCRLREPEKMQQFLQEILTPSEYHDLALRWELMKRLEEGQTQRQIAAELGISLCKITRGARILKQQAGISKHYLKKRRHT